MNICYSSVLMAACTAHSVFKLLRISVPSNHRLLTHHSTGKCTILAWKDDGFCNQLVSGILLGDVLILIPCISVPLSIWLEVWRMYPVKVMKMLTLKQSKFNVNWMYYLIKSTSVFHLLFIVFVFQSDLSAAQPYHEYVRSAVNT